MAQILSFDPCKCRMASPLAFFSYRHGGTVHELAAVQPLRRHTDGSKWRENIFAKPMTLAFNEVEFVLIRHVYDRLRPMWHPMKSASSVHKMSTQTVHLATYLKSFFIPCTPLLISTIFTGA